LRARARVHTHTQYVRTYWVALLVATLVMLIFTTAGLLGVVTISNSVRDQRKADATSTAFVHSRVVAEELRLTTVPLMGISNYVRDTPGHDWATIHAGFNGTARRLVELLGNSGLDENMVVQIAPSAVVNLSYPREGNQKAEGHDLLEDPKQRENALIAIRSREMFLAGPYMLKQVCMCVRACVCVRVCVCGGGRGERARSSRSACGRFFLRGRTPSTHSLSDTFIHSFGSLQIPPLGILDYGSCQC
jgi:hypothetical protein